MTRRSPAAVGNVSDQTMTDNEIPIGILGLQGCFVPNANKFRALGCDPRRIVYPSDLNGCLGLVMPGGESTTMLKSMTDGLWESLLEFGKTTPIWGICAGSILLASKVTHPAQQSLGLMDIDVVRNAYGAQNESFITDLSVSFEEDPIDQEAVFIRAPMISRTGESCTVLARYDNNPVAVQDGIHFATTFHPELTESLKFHQYFLDRLKKKA